MPAHSKFQGITFAGLPGFHLPPATRKPVALLVEDDPEFSLLVCMLLNKQGFDVRTAESGLDALRLARRFVPDIVVLDINLPELNGLEVCRQLKADPQTRTTPVVFCSGEGYLAGEAMALGAAAFLVKPHGVVQLADRLHEILSTQGQTVA